MAEMLMDGIGSGNNAIVDDSHRLWVTGSITSMPPVSISGSIFIGSVSASVDSVYIQSGDNINLGTAWTNTGSVVISGTSMPPWRGIGSVTGNVGISGVKLDNLAGSFGITSLPAILGSVYIKSDIIGISGNIGATIGSTSLYNLGSTAWIIGSVALTNNLGSDAYCHIVSGTSYINVPNRIGISGNDMIGSVVISSAPLIGVSGLIFTDGNLTGSFHPAGIGSVIIQSSNRIGVSGNINISTGSMIILNEITMQDVGSPCFKFSYLTASGTYSDTWKIGGAGSKLEIHGWHISSDNPGYVRMVVSGATPGKIAEYHLNYASGATIEKTFYTPIIPAGPGSAIGFGTTIAGSTCVTIYGREVK